MKRILNAVYISRAFVFSNSLSKPVNSPIISSYYVKSEESNKGIVYLNFIYVYIIF
jgi:hypothetical protein